MNSLRSGRDIRFGMRQPNFDNSVKEYKLSDEELAQYRAGAVKTIVKRKGNEQMAKVVSAIKYNEVLAKLEEAEKRIKQLREEPTKEQIEMLASYILREFSDEPGKNGANESAVDVAVRLLGKFKQLSDEHKKIVAARDDLFIEICELKEDNQRLAKEIKRLQLEQQEGLTLPDFGSMLNDDMQKVIAERDAFKAALKVVL